MIPTVLLGFCWQRGVACSPDAFSSAQTAHGTSGELSFCMLIYEDMHMSALCSRH